MGLEGVAEADRLEVLPRPIAYSRVESHFPPPGGRAIFSEEGPRVRAIFFSRGGPRVRSKGARYFSGRSNGARDFFGRSKGALGFKSEWRPWVMRVNGSL